MKSWNISLSAVRLVDKFLINFAFLLISGYFTNPPLAFICAYREEIEKYIQILQLQIKFVPSFGGIIKFKRLLEVDVFQHSTAITLILYQIHLLRIHPTWWASWVARDEQHCMHEVQSSDLPSLWSLSKIPTTAIAFIALGDESRSSQIHCPKFVTRAFPPTADIQC